VAWPLGRKHTDEVVQQIRESMLRRYARPDVRRLWVASEAAQRFWFSPFGSPQSIRIHKENSQMSDGDSGNSREQDAATVRPAPASADVPKGQSFNATTKVVPVPTKITTVKTAKG
jgi:hypothetical protein